MILALAAIHTRIVALTSRMHVHVQYGIRANNPAPKSIKMADVTCFTHCCNTVEGSASGNGSQAIHRLFFVSPLGADGTGMEHNAHFSDFTSLRPRKAIRLSSFEVIPQVCGARPSKTPSIDEVRVGYGMPTKDAELRQG